MNDFAKKRLELARRIAKHEAPGISRQKYLAKLRSQDSLTHSQIFEVLIDNIEKMSAEEKAAVRRQLRKDSGSPARPEEDWIN